MASHFQIELEKLKNTIIKIGALAEGQVNEALKVLLSEPGAEGKEIKKAEMKIDKLDVKIDEICQSIFALQQPVASDLRFIMSAMQISNEIERIGDLSISIIKKSKSNKDKQDLISKFNLAEIAKQIEWITAKTNDCFKTQNQAAIGEILILNKEIKNECDTKIHEIVTVMKTNSKAVVYGTNLVIILKHLERISEHCSNIVELVYFMINARIIKHENFSDLNI